jgi:hypothetical protein
LLSDTKSYFVRSKDLLNINVEYGKKKNFDLEMQKRFGLLFVGSNIDKMYEMCTAWTKGCEEKNNTYMKQQRQGANSSIQSRKTNSRRSERLT